MVHFVVITFLMMQAMRIAQRTAIMNPSAWHGECHCNKQQHPSQICTPAFHESNPDKQS
jgi:ABC-type phosphate transport system ATPase subunit